MPTLLELIDVHPSVTSRLDARYTRLRAKLPAIDALWLDQYGPLVDGIVTGGQVGVPAAMMQASAEPARHCHQRRRDGHGRP